ncbi:lipase [uncultured Cocleimonas sp.]|uniref:lipase n=1 Tax=uncultured Cocleimonas sp. TaxID=1051587 RepID=UPI002611D0F6|nr:lipase [uncultured Cocleimonas sp.]
MRISTKLTATFASVLFLTACGGGSNHDFDTPIETVEAAPPNGPIFDPAAGKLPTTNDLFFQGSTDGTLNIPNTTDSPVIPQINTLDGFSTSNPIIADFGMALDQSSLTVGDSIRIFQVSKDLSTGAVTGIEREATAAEFTAAAIGDGSTLALIPNAPMAESTSFMVVLTNKIKGADGSNAVSASAYIIARSTVPLTGGDYNDLEPLRQSVNNHETVASALGGVDKDSIVLTWSFTTQSITPVLSAVEASAKAESLIVVPTGQSTNDVNSSLMGSANVYVGTLDVPYYLETPTAENPTAPLTGYWMGAGGSSLTRFNPAPVANTTLTIPVMMTMPQDEAPAEGFPVVIYQHGITRNRTDVLVYADAMANAGFAVIAIDLPMHGASKTVTVGDVEVPNPFHASNTDFDETELSFDLDFVNNTTGEAGPDGIIDDSGTHFINLQSLLTSRDNIRQGVANLLTLRKSLGNIVNGMDGSTIKIDTSKTGFVAHSLGGVVGTTYLGVETQSLPSSVVTAGAPISKILIDSDSFGPRIVAGLEAQGVTGDDLTAFYQAAQWIVDSSDPVNFASKAVANNAIHMIKVVDDGTVPNSSTDVLSSLIGASAVSSTVTDIAPGNAGIVTFNKGAHSSPLTPAGPNDALEYLDVFTEMHTQMATFQGSGGTTILISNPEIIQ